MTIDEFITEFQSNLLANNHKRALCKQLRVRVGKRLHCPITYVCLATVGDSYPISEWRKAAEKINLSPGDAAELVNAADSLTPVNSSIKQTLRGVLEMTYKQFIKAFNEVLAEDKYVKKAFDKKYIWKNGTLYCPITYYYGRTQGVYGAPHMFADFAERLGLSTKTVLKIRKKRAKLIAHLPCQNTLDWRKDVK